MIDKEKKVAGLNLKIGMGVFFVVLVLLGFALGFKLYSGEETDKKQEVALTAEETKAQIALEIKDNRPEVASSFDLTGEEIIEAQEEADVKAFQKIYYIRVNNTQNVNLDMDVDVSQASIDTSSQEEIAGFLEAVNVKVYDSTDDIVLYEGSLGEISDTDINLDLEATAAKKNDTRFRIYYTIDEVAGADYQNCMVNIKTSWTIPEAQVDALKGAQMPSAWIIVAAFVASLIIMLLVYFGLRKHMNQDFVPSESDTYDYWEEKSEEGEPDEDDSDKI